MRFQFQSVMLVVLLSVSACAQGIESPQKKQVTPVTPAASAPTAAPTPRLPADKSKFAIILSGVGGEESYSTQFARWATTLQSTLIERLGFDDKQTLLLIEKPGEGQLRSTAEEVRKAFATVRSAAKPDDALFVFMIGHGSSDGKQSKLSLVGPDLTATDYVGLLKSVGTRRVVIVNMTSASGDFVKPLSTEGWITVTATKSGQEQNATRFPEFFIVALGNAEADLDKNGRVSVLEAFEYAIKTTAAWYEQQGRLATEHAMIDDNGDGVGHPKAEAGDGGLAKATFFDSLPQQQAGGDAELAKLFSERMRLEGQIEQLKTRKDKMQLEQFENELERLLIELADLNKRVRSRQK
ncbi:MAG: hypothetical protein ABI882_10110 [Acidobacteriota bacterium]